MTQPPNITFSIADAGSAVSWRGTGLTGPIEGRIELTAQPVAFLWNAGDPEVIHVHYGLLDAGQIRAGSVWLLASWDLEDGLRVSRGAQGQRMDPLASVGPVGEIPTRAQASNFVAINQGRAISGGAVDAAWAKGIELLGPGTLSRDHVVAMVDAALAHRAV